MSIPHENNPPLTADEAEMKAELRRRVVLVDLPSAPVPLMDFMLEAFARLAVKCRESAVPFEFVRTHFLDQVFAAAEAQCFVGDDIGLETWGSIRVRLTEAMADLCSAPGEDHNADG